MASKPVSGLYEQLVTVELQRLLRVGSGRVATAAPRTWQMLMWPSRSTSGGSSSARFGRFRRRSGRAVKRSSATQYLPGSVKTARRPRSRRLEKTSLSRWRSSVRSGRSAVAPFSRPHTVSPGAAFVGRPARECQRRAFRWRGDRAGDSFRRPHRPACAPSSAGTVSGSSDPLSRLTATPVGRFASSRPCTPGPRSDARSTGSHRSAPRSRSRTTRGPPGCTRKPGCSSDCPAIRRRTSGHPT